MYKENKRRRHDESHHMLECVVDGTNKPEAVDHLPPISNFFTLNEFIGDGNDVDYCIMYMKKGNPTRVLSTNERMSLLCNHHLYSSPGARRCITICCEIPCQHTHESSRLSSNQVQRLINDLVMELSHAKNASLLSDDDTALNDDDYTAWTGWTLDQLKSMTSLIAPRIRYSKYRSPFEAVCLFWTKLKTKDGGS